MNGLAWGVFYVLIFPGLFFCSVAGLLVSWVDRKVTARVQMRVGPPWWQPFADFVKLTGKETIVPRGASKLAFLGAPLLGLAGVTLVSAIVWTAILKDTALVPETLKGGFAGDLIVVLYLLTWPSLAVILGGSASRNVLGAVGASREMKLVFAYELPFVLAASVALIKSGGELSMSGLLDAQAGGAFALSISGAVALIVAFLCIQGKLALVPFDAPEAETEIMGGALIEYSGTPLAIFKLTKAMLLFTVPVFVVALLWGGFRAGFSESVGRGILDIVLDIGKFLVPVVLVTLIRNTNPRVRIEHAVKFYWGPLTALAALAAALAWAGKQFELAWL